MNKNTDYPHAAKFLAALEVSTKNKKEFSMADLVSIANHVSIERPRPIQLAAFLCAQGWVRESRMVDGKQIVFYIPPPPWDNAKNVVDKESAGENTKKILSYADMQDAYLDGQSHGEKMAREATRYSMAGEVQILVCALITASKRRDVSAFYSTINIIKTYLGAYRNFDDEDWAVFRGDQPRDDS